jgi:antitoxin component YwqK of YwqJK toxin-antitoxin module
LKKKSGMFRVLLLIAFLFPIIIYGQVNNKLILKGGIYSVKSDEPISFATINIKSTTIGAITKDDGKFELPIDPINLNDTIVVQCIGYKRFVVQLSKINLKQYYRIELEDSLFLLNEVVAMAFDNIEALRWKSKRNDQSQYLLTFSTRELQNAANYINILKETFSNDAKIKTNFIRWKKIKINGIPDKVNFTISWFRCPYCPDAANVAVTLEVLDRKDNNLIENEKYRKPLITYFQNLLDKTFAQGVDNSQLENRSQVMYLKKASEPYNGQCYGYYETGQKGLRGAYKNGLKNGFWEYWYSNNQKKIEGNYTLNKKTGEWRYWYSNGQLRIVANYVDDEMDGKNVWYFENGQKKKEATFRNGVYLEKTEWDEKGNVVNIQNFLH